jgi:tetratricopeptide (TPR) repeat protein
MAVTMLYVVLNSFYSLFSESWIKKESMTSVKSNGEKAFDDGDFKSAVEFFSEKIESDPNNIFYLTRRCETLMKLELFEEAQHNALKIMGIDKDYRKGYIIAAKCSLAFDDKDRAEKIVQELNLAQPVTQTELDEEFPELKIFKNLESEIDEKFETKMFRECIVAIEKLQEMIHVKTIRLCMLKAKCHFHLEGFKESKAILLEILEKEKENIEAFFILANCIYHEGDLSNSVLTYEAILKIQNDKRVFDQNEKVKKLLELMQIGQKLYQQRKYQKSVGMFTKAFEIEKNNKEVTSAILNNRGMALKKSRYFKSAVEDFDESFKLNSENKSIHEKRAYPLYKIGKYIECISDCEEAIKLGGSKDFKELKDKAEKKLKNKKRWSVSSQYRKFPQPWEDRSGDTSTLSSILDLYIGDSRRTLCGE